MGDAKRVALWLRQIARWRLGPAGLGAGVRGVADGGKGRLRPFMG